MGKLALIARVGANDNGLSMKAGEYAKSANVDFLYHNNAADVSLRAFLDNLKRLRLEPSEIAMDMLVIACTMYAADTRINRQDFGEDNWTRVIDLYIPVSDVSVWNQQKDILQQIFKFLTGDIWTINFRQRADADLKLCPKGRLKRYQMPYVTDQVCLFSGGMDSFIGAVNLLEEGKRPLLVGHSKSADVSPYQEKCGTALAKAYVKTPPERIYAFIKIPKQNLFNSEEHTERGRSFMFLTLGAICASALNSKSTLFVPENGMISLNIPLTPLRVGSHSTRTTHPAYFSMMQMLFDGINLGVTINNPFQYLTKGEMLKTCANQQLVASTETMSCSHPSGRWEGFGNQHCGYCVPCIIRRAAYKSAGVIDRFPYRKDILDRSGLKINKAEGADVLAFKFMIEKAKKHPFYLTAAIRNTGPLGSDVDEFVNVYHRSLIEVESLLAGAILK